MTAPALALTADEKARVEKVQRWRESFARHAAWLIDHGVNPAEVEQRAIDATAALEGTSLEALTARAPDGGHWQ